MAEGAMILVIFGLIIGILWIILPFAIFGMKPLVRAQIAETKRTNDLLEKLLNAQGVVSNRPSVGLPPIPR